MSTTHDTPEQIGAFFQENGYYVAKGVFAPGEVESLEHDFDRIVTQISRGTEEINARWGGAEVERLGGANTQILHTHNVQQYSGVWLRALMQARLLSVIEAIIGPDIVLHHTKLFQKPPENGAPFPMHQDWTYFPSVKDTMMAGIIHVTNATDEMGCLRVYPGSHRLGRIEGTSGTQHSELLEKYPLEDATIIEAEPGDVAFFHYFTLHGSRPNTSNRTRKTVLAQFHAGDDSIEEAGRAHPNERLVLQGWNSQMTRNAANEGK